MHEVCATYGARMDSHVTEFVDFGFQTFDFDGQFQFLLFAFGLYGPAVLEHPEFGEAIERVSDEVLRVVR